MLTTTLQDNVAILKFDAQGYPMNVINEATMTAFATELEAAIANPDVKGIVLTSDRKEFVVGADLNMLLALTTPEQIFEMTKGLNNLLRRMETCGKPVVAALNGSALGGGYEIALATHYIVAVADPKIQIGLPEVQIGVLPGGGGTQRLPRRVGLQVAMEHILQAKRVRPDDALRKGLIDATVPTLADLIPKAIEWINTVGRKVQPWDEKSYKMPGGGVMTPGGGQVMTAGIALLRSKTFGNYPNAYYALSAIYEGTLLPMERALVVEARYFTKALTSKEAKLMIRTLFFSLNEANKGAARPKDVPAQPLQKIGVLGAGMMGAGIAYVSAIKGMDVVLKDVDAEAAERGKAYSRKLLQKKVEKGHSTKEKMEAQLAKITATGNAADLAGCDLVIEAVFEDRELKARVTAEAEAVMNPAGTFASNTSTLPITGLAQASARPEKFIGLHFFSPVDKMPLVEIIIGEKTGKEAIAMAVDYVKAIGKTPIVVRDGRGFYTSRVFATYVNEGMELLLEGCPPAMIENAGKAAGMPVGPLALADEVSLSLLYHIVKQTEKDLGIVADSAAAKVGKVFVEQLDRVGKKANKGFYEYPEDEPKFLWPELTKHFPTREGHPDYETMKRRMLHIQAVETAKCLEEGILMSPRDADVGSIMGWGFAPFAGGTASYVDYIGPREFLAQCDDFAARFGPRFAVPASLRARAEQGKGYYD